MTTTPEEEKRNPSKEILLYLFDHSKLIHYRIANDLNLNPKTVKFTLEKLKEAGVVDQDSNGKWSLTRKYKISFIDIVSTAITIVFLALGTILFIHNDLFYAFLYLSVTASVGLIYTIKSLISTYTIKRKQLIEIAGKKI